MFQKYKSLTPTIILLLLSTWTFINSMNGYILTNKHYLGLTASLISLTVYFALNKFYKYILSATLILGLFNLINFTPALTTWSFNVNGFGLGIQPYLFLIILLTILILKPKKDEVAVIESTTVTQLHTDRLIEETEKFKNLFDDKSTSELQEIIDDKRFTKAAKDAAQFIINGRETK